MKGRVEKMEIMQNGMHVISSGSYLCQDAGSKMCTSINSCLKLFSVLAFYFCDIADGRDKYGVQNGTMDSQSCTCCLANFEEFGSVEWTPTRDIEGTLRDRVEYENTMGKTSVT